MSVQLAKAFLKSCKIKAPFEVYISSPFLNISTLKLSEQVWASAGKGRVNSYPIVNSIEDISFSWDKSNNWIKFLIWGIAKSQFLSLFSENITLWTWSWLKFLVCTDFE